MPRPPLDAVVKTAELRIRLTPHERNAINIAAKRDGKPSSTWGRDTMLLAAMNQPETKKAAAARKRRTN